MDAAPRVDLDVLPPDLAVQQVFVELLDPQPADELDPAVAALVEALRVFLGHPAHRAHGVRHEVSERVVAKVLFGDLDARPTVAVDAHARDLLLREVHLERYRLEGPPAPVPLAEFLHMPVGNPHQRAQFLDNGFGLVDEFRDQVQGAHGPVVRQ